MASGAGWAQVSRLAEVLSSLAAMHTELWLVHKEPGNDAKAKEYLEKSEKAESKSEDRYGSKALHILASGKPKEADDFVEDLRKKGASIALEPANAAYETRIFGPDRVRIQGRLVGLIRRY